MDDQQKYIEDFGLFFEQMGLNRTAGRIFGWLLICDPPEQTLDDLTEALQMAKSTISTSARFLTEVGIIERVSKPGIRKDFYRISPTFWENALNASIEQFRGFKHFAEVGLRLIDEETSEHQRRTLTHMHSLYSFMMREFPAMLERWEEEHKDDG